MSNNTFDFLRFLAEIGITAVGTFYKVIAEIWSLPYGEAVLQVAQYVCVLDENSRQSHLLS